MSKQLSIYKDTEIKDFYLGLWQPLNWVFDDNDPIITIPTLYHLRPDLMAYDIYGSPKYWWVFAYRNLDLIPDPINDFIAGLNIYLPSKSVING